MPAVIMVGVPGVSGCGMKLPRFEPAPALWGCIVGPMTEASLRRALLISGGDVSIFWTRSPGAVIPLVCLALILYPVAPPGRIRVQAAPEE